VVKVANGATKKRRMKYRLFLAPFVRLASGTMPKRPSRIPRLQNPHGLPDHQRCPLFLLIAMAQ